MANSCTTISYLWLFRDSPTLWSVALISPIFVARGCDFANFVCKRLFYLSYACCSFHAFDGRDSGRSGSRGSLLSLPHDVDLVSIEFSVKFLWTFCQILQSISWSSRVNPFVAESAAELVKVCLNGYTRNDDWHEVIAFARSNLAMFENIWCLAFVSLVLNTKFQLRIFQIWYWWNVFKKLNRDVHVRIFHVDYSLQTASAACPEHPGSLEMISMTSASVICDVDDPCSVNTA